jgi:hypothetical protein
MTIGPTVGSTAVGEVTHEVSNCVHIPVLSESVAMARSRPCVPSTDWGQVSGLDQLAKHLNASEN